MPTFAVVNCQPAIKTFLNTIFLTLSPSTHQLFTEYHDISFPVCQKGSKGGEALHLSNPTSKSLNLFKSPKYFFDRVFGHCWKSSIFLTSTIKKLDKIHKEKGIEQPESLTLNAFNGCHQYLTTWLLVCLTLLGSFPFINTYQCPDVG